VPDDERGRGPSWSFGTGKRADGAPKGAEIGPGAYQLQDGIGSATPLRHAAPAFGFGTSQRAGPGARSTSPGPGAYAPADPTLTSRKVGFGTSQRPSPGRETEGPGYLLPPMPPVPPITFGKDARFHGPQGVDTPGPKYELGDVSSLSTKHRGPAFTMRPR
jgi:hypothetical protein